MPITYTLVSTRDMGDSATSVCFLVRQYAGGSELLLQPGGSDALVMLTNAVLQGYQQRSKVSRV